MVTIKISAERERDDTLIGQGRLGAVIRLSRLVICPPFSQVRVALFLCCCEVVSLSLILLSLMVIFFSISDPMDSRRPVNSYSPARQHISSQNAVNWKRAGFFAFFEPFCLDFRFMSDFFFNVTMSSTP